MRILGAKVPEKIRVIVSGGICGQTLARNLWEVSRRNLCRDPSKKICRDTRRKP